MRRQRDNERSARAVPFSLVVLAFLSATSIGCGRTCVSFFSNPSDGTLSVNASTCSLNDKQTGTVRLRLDASPSFVAKPAIKEVQHVYVSVRGVEAHASPVAHDGSPEWSELVPSLTEQPVQVDLMARNEDSSAPNFIGDAAAFPVGSYTEIRMLLVPNASVSGERVPERNSCTGTAFNCIVTANGSVLPLAMDAVDSRILISAAGLDGGIFHVFPDTRTNLDLEFMSDSLVVLAPGSTVWLVPVFTVHSKFSPESRE
jgi:Domain of unknown function (DUF4382)